jgi:NitT/TauT family transport system substrate-binding protein
VGVQDGTYAKDLGSTKLETQIFNAGPAAVEALFAGSIDAAYVGPNPAINAFTKSNGEAVRIVSGASSGGAQLVVQPQYTTAASLKGTTLATPQLGGTQDVALRFWLKQNGLSAPTTGTGDVTVAPQENAQTLDLFKQGKIAGAWLPEPWASRLVTEAGATVLVDEKSLWPQGAFVTTHLIVSTQFLQQHPQTVTKLLQAEADTLAEVTADPTKAKATANEALKALTGKQLKAAALDRAWGNLTLTLDPIASTLQTSADHGVEVGTTKKADLKGIYDLTLLNALLVKSGKPPVSAAGLGSE